MGEIFIVSLLSQCFFYRGPDLGDLIAGYGHESMSVSKYNETSFGKGGEVRDSFFIK